MTDLQETDNPVQLAVGFKIDLGSVVQKYYHFENYNESENRELEMSGFYPK